MSNLIKHEENLSLSKKIEFSTQTSILRDHDSESIHDIAKVALLKAKQVTGYNTSAEDLRFFISDIKQELLSNFKGLHLSEIAIAFELWSKKHYGEWTGFTVSNFITYGLRPYYGDQTRIMALKPKKEKKELPPQPYDGTNRFSELKKQFTETGWAEDTGNIIYDWLLETGKIELGYGNQFYNEAKERLTKENKAKLITELNSVVRQSVTNFLRTIESNSSNLTVVLAKKIAINHFIKNNQL